MDYKETETYTYKGYSIEMHPDYNAENPREWCDHFTNFVMFHDRYQFGDETDFREPEDALEYFKENDCLVLPIYAYIHSGITIWTGPFSCPWDSGQIGWVYCDKEDVRKKYGVKRVSKQLQDKVYELMEAEIDTLDKWLTGDVWGYEVFDPEGEDIDSCWGFYGQDDCLNEAKRAVDWDIKRKGKQFEMFQETAKCAELVR